VPYLCLSSQIPQLVLSHAKGSLVSLSNSSKNTRRTSTMRSYGGKTIRLRMMVGPALPLKYSLAFQCVSLVPFPPFRDEFHPKRNQVRLTLATLPTTGFKDISSDVFLELWRRYPGLWEPQNQPDVNSSRRFEARAGKRPIQKHEIDADRHIRCFPVGDSSMAADMSPISPGTLLPPSPGSITEPTSTAYSTLIASDTSGTSWHSQQRREDLPPQYSAMPQPYVATAKPTDSSLRYVTCAGRPQPFKPL
jgi:hypothetical protein